MEMISKLSLSRLLANWRKMTERMNAEDKENLKSLYVGLKELTEYEYRLLWDKYYLSTGKRPDSDKVMAEKYGIDKSDYYKKRQAIEIKLNKHVVVSKKPLSSGATIVDIINEVVEDNKCLYGERFNSIELKK
ncbi:hypothetical protein [Carnobacterium pleistocenium]|uniref:hypothetical protein n=1 Tax=Carnobacterium pleistocenium TaxID=181073 RepID=UPI000557C129|nr:hypothetical protein [Carnobacterium pleistocenium]